MNDQEWHHIVSCATTYGYEVVHYQKVIIPLSKDASVFAIDTSYPLDNLRMELNKDGSVTLVWEQHGREVTLFTRIALPYLRMVDLMSALKYKYRTEVNTGR